MLYVIETRQGRVLNAYPCDDGIDQAIDIIAAALSHPEEDFAAAADVVADNWQDAVVQADELGGDTAIQRFSISRQTVTQSWFGLVSL